MEDLLQIEELVPVEDVLQRWNIQAYRLNEIAKAERILFFFIVESRVRPYDGKTIHFCTYFTELNYDIHEEQYVTEDIFLIPENIKAYENDHPEILWALADRSTNLIKEYGEEIPAEEIRKMLRMSPMQFIDFMNSGQGPICSLEEDFREYQENLYPDAPFFSTSMLHNKGFTFHVFDWERWRSVDENGNVKATKSNKPIDSGKEALLLSTLQSKENRIAELEKELAAARGIMDNSCSSQPKCIDLNHEKKQDAPENIIGLVSLGEEDTAIAFCLEKDIHITELEQANTELANKLAERDNEIAKVKAQLEEGLQCVGTFDMEGHGLCSIVICMRQKGKPDEEIAKFLSDEGKWCSAAQVGALLFRGNRTDKESMRKHGNRLLGKA